MGVELDSQADPNMGQQLYHHQEDSETEPIIQEFYCQDNPSIGEDVDPKEELKSKDPSHQSEVESTKFEEAEVIGQVNPL
jgi:hypothetical protein